MLLVVVLVVAGGVGYLYYPRGRSLSAAVAATLAVLNADISARRGGADFEPALDGDLLADGDVVRSSQDGRAVLTFFDASTLTVDPGSVVKVATLNPLGDGGIQLTIEQTLGRTWASVSKLKTPESKFEVKTPTSTAAVRGTAFETVVERRPDGTTSVTYRVYGGLLLVTAVAGGQVTVGAGTQVTIAQGQPAPVSSTPIAPSPELRLVAAAGLGYALVGPTGAACGSAGSRQEIFGCLVAGDSLSIHGPRAGTYTLILTSAAAASNATVTIEAARGTTTEATRTLTRTFAVGDLVRTTFTYGDGSPLTLGVLEPAQLVTSICGAEATGHVFSSGSLDERYGLLQQYVRSNRGLPISFVVTETDVVQVINDQLGQADPSGPLAVRDLTLRLDAGGAHVSANLGTPLGTFAVSGTVVAGSVNGRLVVRVRDLSAGPLPAALLDRAREAIEERMNDAAQDIPFTIRRVMLRGGCLAVMGTSPD